MKKARVTNKTLGEREAAQRNERSSIRDELLAAYVWAKMDRLQRDKFTTTQGSSLKTVVEYAALTFPPFDFSTFTAQTGKKNFGESLSRHLASRFATVLSSWFQGILPNPDGTGHESRARTSKGYKRLDVNYSTPELGLGLGISIKTINSIDTGSGRYTKNYTRVDAELRAEGADYHERQPYATMIAIIFLPMSACDDATDRSPSSFGAAVKLFRNRAGRKSPKDSVMLFERVFIGLYDTDAATFGDVVFVDVEARPPRSGRPTRTIDFPTLISMIVEEYDSRNNPPFEWDDDLTDTGPEHTK
jgi:hypothetical protein